MEEKLFINQYFCQVLFRKFCSLSQFSFRDLILIVSKISKVSVYRIFVEHIVFYVLEQFM